MFIEIVKALLLMVVGGVLSNSLSRKAYDELAFAFLGMLIAAGILL